MTSFSPFAISSLLMTASIAVFPASPAAADRDARLESRTDGAVAEYGSWCATQEPWERRTRAIGLLGGAGGCPQMGPCDSPGTRDSTSIDPLNVRVIVHVLRGEGNPGVSQDSVDAMIARMNADYSSNTTGIQFTLLATRYHDDDLWATLPCDTAARIEVDSVRTRYAETPASACNIYITAQYQNCMHRAGALSTLPWDPNALDTLGGFWLNQGIGGAAIGFATNAASHEMGHVLGLYHTHQGPTEYSCGHPCYEYACGLLGCGPENDTRGDFAADTPATPSNDTCAPPGGVDCEGTPWGPTQTENIMGYAPDRCRTLFTPQQVRRMQCWTKSVLTGWLIQPVAVGEVGPAAAVDVVLRPNPAVREVVVAFSLAGVGDATIELLDLSGRRVARRTFAGLLAGNHVVNLNEGRGLAPGVYVVRLTQESVVAWRKAVLVH